MNTRALMQQQQQGKRTLQKNSLASILIKGNNASQHCLAFRSPPQSFDAMGPAFKDLGT